MAIDHREQTYALVISVLALAFFGSIVLLAEMGMRVHYDAMQSTIKNDLPMNGDYELRNDSRLLVASFPSEARYSQKKSNFKASKLHYTTSSPSQKMRVSMKNATSNDYKISKFNATLENTVNSGSLKSVSQVLLAAVILGSVFLAAKKLISSYDVGDAILTTTFATAVILALAYRSANPIGWKLVLSAFGYKTSTFQSARIWLVSESRRWLPGGVWGYASRAVQAGKMGVPISVASASMLVELLITMAAAVIVSLLGLLVNYEKLSGTLQQLASEKTGGGSALAFGWAVLAIIAVSGLGFAARHKFASKVRGLAERFAALRSVKLTWTKLFAALGYMTAMAGLNGCVNLTLLQVVDGASSVPMLVVIAATATAWIVGFLAFFSPGGILVREATLAALLLPWLPYEAGITLAVLSRIAQLLAEVVCMVSVLWIDMRQQVDAKEVV